MTTPDRFTWERALRQDPSVPWPVKSFLLLYGTYFDGDGGNAWPSAETLASNAGLSRQRVFELLKEAHSLGWLGRGKRSRHAVVRVAAIPETSDRSDRSNGPEKSDGSDSSKPRRQTGRTKTSDGSDSRRQMGLTQPLQDHSKTTHTARVEPEMLVNPEDRQPQSPAAVADRLRNSHGVQWSDRHVKDALDRLTRVLGGDKAAAGKARSVLAHLAQRRAPIKSLPAWLGAFSDDKLCDEFGSMTSTAADEKPSRRRCGECVDGWLGVDDQGRPIRCPLCRPARPVAA